MKAVQDFNYKVALASGLKHLQSGKLKQAEEQFRYLVSRFPRAEGGYRGLARVRTLRGDAPGAVAALRDGASALARGGERAIAIDLLREATGLDPRDLAAHRRLAAALALAGDVGAAAEEHIRFATAELAAGGEDRARAEASYALETLGEIPALHDIARTLGIELRTVRRADEAAEGSPATAVEAAPAEARGAAAEDPMVLEARAMALIGARDPGAGGVAIEATRALIAAGKVQAASDLLLEIVASGIAAHEAQQELIAIARALGRDDLANERARLLEEVRALG